VLVSLLLVCQAPAATIPSSGGAERKTALSTSTRRRAAVPVSACRHRTAQLAFDLAGEIHLIDVDGRNDHRLTEIGNHPAWSPNGTQIAFARGGDIYVVRADGSRLRRLTRDGNGSNPSWSPDGKQIYFSGYPGLFVVNSDGSGRRTLEPSSFPDAWSPDGRRFAVGSKTGIDLVRADGTDRRHLPSGDAQALTWLPGGRIIFETLRRDTATGIAVVDTDGRGLKQLTRGGYDPAPSPNGTQFAFSKPVAPNAEAESLYIANTDGGRPRLLTRSDLTIGSIAWSPGGKWIVFSRGPDVIKHPYDIWAIRPDGRRLHNITQRLPYPGDSAEDPTWKPCNG
jgi:Tol biopolymer transport system component